MWNCHSWPLDATTRGRSTSRSATWSANMSSHSRNVKLLFLTTRCHYCRYANCSANMSSNSRNVKLPFLTTRCHHWGVDLPLDLPIWALTVEMWNCHSWPLDVTTGGSRSASRSANMSSHSRNAKLLFLTTRCHYCRSANWSANMSSNSRNVKLPFLTTRCHYWGVDLSLDLPIWALKVAMWNCHSWPLDASTSGVDLPIDLLIWALSVEM